MKATNLADYIKPKEFLLQAASVTTLKAIVSLLDQLPIVSEHQYAFDEDNPEKGWKEGKLHWVPVGRERGNEGRIKLASHPENPIAERLINGMEALIELMRRLELLKDPNAAAPQSPREAVMRYFSLPPLDQLPKMLNQIRGKSPREHAREIARLLRVRALYDKTQKEFSIIIEDDGIGQTPEKIHSTLLSLGASDKGDKPYLIGLFGQGGSSSYAASEYSWCISRRAPALLDGKPDGAGWTVIKEVFPKNRRDPYFAYLAAHPDGRVPSLDSAAADAIGLKHGGTRFAHLKYDFGGRGSAVMRRLFYMLNHILYNPVLPFDLYAGRDKPDTIYGNGYRLSNASTAKKTLLDKTFAPQQIIETAAK